MEPVRKELSQVDADLKKVAREATNSVGDFLCYAVEGRGKKIRPALTLLAGKSFSPDPALSIIMATAVELLHIATLIHDDMVDRSSLRWGRPTLSSLWGKDVAVLVGDYAFARAATYVCDTSNVRAIRRFAETILALSSGELSELVQAYSTGLTRQDYLGRISNKTASLFATAAECGAILSKAPEEWVQRFADYGRSLGIAFQILDDILDFSGDSEEVGKPVGHDLRQGTLTLPTILLLERYPVDNPIARLFQKMEPEANLQEAIAMVQNSGVIEEAYAIAKGYCADAVRSLEGLPSPQLYSSLAGLAEYVLERRR